MLMPSSSMKISQEALAILERIRNELSTTCQSFLYKENISEVRTRMRDIINAQAMGNYYRLGPDLITEKINRTSWPDELVLEYLRLHDMKIYSLHVIREITLEYIIEEDRRDPCMLYLRPHMQLVDIYGKLYTIRYREGYDCE